MLTLFRPFNDLFRWEREVVDPSWPRWGNGERIGFTPSVDIEELEDRLILRADLPGVDEKQVEVKVHDGQLLITGSREELKERGDHAEGRRTYSERRFGSFCRTFSLGPRVDPSRIEATYKNGVLSVTVPKREEAKPQQIPVSTS